MNYYLLFKTGKFNWVLLLCILLASCVNSNQKSNDNIAVSTEKGYYQNPVLGGDYPDPSVLRVDSDFYMTHSSFDYYPGLLIWHSTDLIHWERVTHALNKYVGSVWAPDFIKYKDTYYIYFPAGGTNWVVTAKSPEDPWSDPVDLNLHGFIDPGHIAGMDGQRYLYLSKGYIVKLTDDGLSAVGEPVHNYDGWQYPENWSTECFCLESPKSTVKDGYYHLIVAEGGTAGPATSHMVVSARSESPYGPFENSPYNPIVHTANRNERWWSQGHGTLVDDVEGNWWIMYQGYENGFHTLGRQTLMLPVEWTKDKWFRIPVGVHSSDTIKAPTGVKSNHSTSLSDDFNGNGLSLQWQFFKHYDPSRILISDGKLAFRAVGNSFNESSPLLVNSSDQKYEVSVEYTLEDETVAGLCLFYNERANVRIEVSKDQFTVFNQQKAKAITDNQAGNHGYLRILNDANEASFYISADGKEWTKAERSIETSGLNHNVFGEFLSLRAGIYAFGNGNVWFDNFEYERL